LASWTSQPSFVGLTSTSPAFTLIPSVARVAMIEPSKTSSSNFQVYYALRKDLWAFTGNRISVRFQYESRDRSGQWWRSYGNEQWEFDAEGSMRRREASINDLPIDETERRIIGPRPESERGAPLPPA
jgi:nuclear transport factor 2 (NTF2) superfamily protein